MFCRTSIVRGLAGALGLAAACGAQAACFDLPGSAACRWAAAGGGAWHVHMGGASIHSSETKAPGREWNERHEGVGAELRRKGLPWRDADPLESWQTRYAFGTFVDSRNIPSYYTGTVVAHELARMGGLRLDGGAGAFLFYRSASWSGRMQLAPAVLPVLSMTDSQGGVGLNLIWRPPGFDGPATIFLQITRPLGR